MRLSGITGVLLLFSGWTSVLGQMAAHARLDNNAIMVGDQVTYELSFTCPAGYKVMWPQLDDTLTGSVEIVRRTVVDSAFSQNRSEKIYTQRLTITSFDSGYHALPPVSIGYKTPGDQQINYAATGALLLAVNTLPVNLQDDIKDIKGPISAPFTFREALPYLLGLLGAGLITFLMIYYLKKRKKAEPIFSMPVKPSVQPYQAAIDALENLRLKKLWQNGRIKEYHTELTDIIREYMSAQFSIHAHEFTSEEIIQAVDTTGSNQEARNKLRQMLMIADLVKFAKMEPLPVEHDACLNYAIDFVRETKHLNNVDRHTVNAPEPGNVAGIGNQEAEPADQVRADVGKEGSNV